MPVQDWMSKDLVTIDEETSIMKASRVMKQNDIQHLPVLKKGRLVGIVSDRDLKEATPSKATTLDIHEMYHLLDTITVKSLMPKNLYTIAPGDTVEKAAAVMLKHHISALPVVDAARRPGRHSHQGRHLPGLCLHLGNLSGAPGHGLGIAGSAGIH